MRSTGAGTRHSSYSFSDRMARWSDAGSAGCFAILLPPPVFTLVVSGGREKPLLREAAEPERVLPAPCRINARLPALAVGVGEIERREDETTLLQGVHTSCLCPGVGVARNGEIRMLVDIGLGRFISRSTYPGWR